jgi:PAS domain S-box-containing protein
MLNDLTVAIAGMQALLDGKLAPDQRNFQDILEALEDLAARIADPRAGAPASAAPGKENLLNLVVEAAPNAMVLVNERGRMTLVNAQAEKLFHYTRDELLGQSIEMLVPERFRFGHPELRNSFNASPIARPMGAGRDLRGRRKDGSEIPIEIALNPIKTDAGHLVLAAIVDITERKRAEELRLLHVGAQRHAAELEELNIELASASRFKTQFVATMSHELRTPLTAIIGAAELLNKADLDARELTCVQTITGAAEALFVLINSILDFSKIEAGKMEVRKEPFEVETILEGAAEVVAQLAREKGVTLHTYVDPAIPAVCGDGDRLRQVLLNLLGNAVKFTDRGCVVARAVAHDVGARDVVLRFEVRDTGLGMDPEVLPRLFEPFSQVQASARTFGGTGLGLSIAKRLVELMGGEIGVQSTPGVGSLFWFTIRCERAEEPVLARNRTLDAVGAVIVSGDDTFAHIVERYLSAWSMQTWRVENHAGLFQALGSTDPSRWIAIIDRDDTGAAAGLAAKLLGESFPMRVVTIGKEGPLRKPVRQAHLFEAVAQALHGERRPAATNASVQTPETARGAHATGRVLVAEDDARLRRLLVLQFEQLDVPVTFVGDGLDAVEELQRDTYALVFMDAHMPNMDGLSATRAIREAERGTGRHTPIVAMTASAFSEDRDACIAAGMDEYFAKPVKLADVRAAIERWTRAGMVSM